MTSTVEQGTHFWLMSFLFRNAVGHWTPPPGTTRFDAFQELRRQAIEANPALSEAVVTNFDIQPNQL